MPIWELMPFGATPLSASFISGSNISHLALSAAPQIFLHGDLQIETIWFLSTIIIKYNPKYISG
jgi:hypothetical protein